jgi:hypothetical protein
MMIRKLKRLGISLIAAFAMSSVVASAASAEAFWFKTDGSALSTTTLTGSQVGQNVFEVDAGKLTCSTVTYSGSISGNTATTFTINPHYTGCVSFGTFPSTVTMNSCRYVIHTDTKSGTEYHATTTIECDGNDEIIVTAKTAAGVVKCVTHIPPQNLGTGKSFKNIIKNGIAILTIIDLILNLKYSQKEGEGLGKCPNALNTTNGKYSGSGELEGRNAAGEATALWVE